MTATGAIARIIVVLGVCMLFVNLIFPGANPAWGTLETTLSTGPNFPSFTNPYDTPIDTVNMTFQIVGNGIDDTPVATGCSQVNYYRCLNNSTDFSAPTSYFTVDEASFPDRYYSVQGAFYPAQSTKVSRVEVIIWCRSSIGIGNAYVNWSLADGTNFLTLGSLGTCQGGSTFTFLGMTYTQTNPALQPALNAISGMFVRFFTSNGNAIQISAFAMRFFTQGNQSVCTGGDWACILGGGIHSILLPFELALNGLVFGLSSIFAAAVWAVQLISLFFLGIIQSLVFLVTMPGTGIPSFFLGIIDIGVFAMLGIMIVIILFWVRGVGTVGI